MIQKNERCDGIRRGVVPAKSWEYDFFEKTECQYRIAEGM
jgi:hypothetical protein